MLICSHGFGFGAGFGFGSGFGSMHVWCIVKLIINKINLLTSLLL
jgi:hypothetical protein